MPLLPDSLTDNDRFYNFKTSYPENAIRHGLENGIITPDDVKLIKAFVTERQITNSIKGKRVLKWTSMLIQLRRFIGPFRNNTILEIYEGVQGISNGMSTRGKPYSAAAKSDLIMTIKTFYTWMIDNEIVDLPEKKIKAIKRQTIQTTKTAADLFSPEEITRMMEGCLTNRDRAIFMTLYEGGFRIGEIGQMKWGDLKFDGTGVIATVKFKTDKPRYVRLVMALEHLIKWKSEYPKTITDDSFVFLNERGKPLTHGTVSKQLIRIAERAAITKHITPHIFRHSRTTHLIQQGVSESVIKMILWGSPNSNMFSHYAHLSGCDVDREIFNLYGITPATTQVTETQLEPKICQHCKEINSPISNHCHICGQPLTGKALASSEEFQQFLLNNSDLLMEFLQEQKAKVGGSHAIGQT